MIEKKRIILNLFLLIFLIEILSATSVNNYYILDLNYNNGNFTLLSGEVQQFKEEIHYFGNYTLVLWDYENNILDSYFFDVPNKILYDILDENGTITGGGEKVLDDVNFTLQIPYYMNATKIRIYDAGLSKKLEIDVSMYLKTYEDYKKFNNLNQDPGEENPTQKESNADKDNSIKDTFFEKAMKYWWILAAILIILLAVLIRYITKQK